MFQPSNAKRSFPTVEPSGRPFAFRDVSHFVKPETQPVQRRKTGIRTMCWMDIDAFEQDGEGVTAHSVTVGNAEDPTVLYLVGCDGAASGVRRQLGRPDPPKTSNDRRISSIWKIAG